MRKRHLIFLLTYLLIFLACSDSETPVVNSSTADTTLQSRTLEIQPQPVYAWVDQLRVRQLPTLDAPVIIEVGEGDTLFFLNEKTVEKVQLTLREKKFNEPWLKVRTQSGREGWVYGGGVTPFRDSLLLPD